MSTAEQTYVTQENKTSVKVFWLPKEVCQSHEQESKACTLIAVMVVYNCHQDRIEFTVDKPSEQLINTFNKSIGQGNAIYERLRETGMLKEKYLNIPEALLAVASNTPSANTSPVKEWDSFFYYTDMQKSLYLNLNENLKKWYRKRALDASSDLNVVILANLRAVVLVFNRKAATVTLMDSHSHCPYGAVIALVPIKSLENLCKWYALQLTKDTSPVACYELSFLYCR